MDYKIKFQIKMLEIWGKYTKLFQTFLKSEEILFYFFEKK